MANGDTTHEEPERQRVPALLIFSVFLRLGLTSFGGPIAHLGYFRRELVARRGWLSPETFDELVALCQFLPGPASSQTGFAIGLRKAGLAGGLAAFVGFTLPSALIMLGAAYGVARLDADLSALVQGLNLVAVSVVAHAVIAMARTQVRRPAGMLVAVAALTAMLAAPTPATAPLAILVAGLAGALMDRRAEPAQPAASPRGSLRLASFACLAAFLILLAGLPMLLRLAPSPGLRIAEGFYRSGALVFGGGHAVLPLLNAVTAHDMAQETFLAGYGLAQALPGPLFAFAAYLGALAGPGAPDWKMGLLGLAALFLPGLLLVAAADPWWTRLRTWPPAGGLVRYASAAVVGILAVAWWSPVAASGVRSPVEALIALAGFVLLFIPRVPALLVVLGVAGAGMLAG